MSLRTINYSRSENDRELQKILEIQQRNIKPALPATVYGSEGFVTVVHNLELLRKMQEYCPHILAKRGAEVIGYALAMVPEMRAEVPVLDQLFELTDQLLDQKTYLVMGQICIDKPYRGQGIFRGMYNFYREQLNGTFDCLITEVAQENERSLQAHLHLGFEVLERRVEQGVGWELLIWNWKA